jgi:hypothetical protein
MDKLLPWIYNIQNKQDIKYLEYILSKKKIPW